jgi:4-amino-4-deoxy-L-arabinose transferase-like glycosyltransferase
MGVRLFKSSILQSPILCLALTLRLLALNTRPLWYDEAFAVLFAEKGFRAMLAGTLTPVAGAASDVHPIAYYTALDFWMRVFGQSPFAVRLLSVFLGTLTLAVMYAIGRRLFHREAATVGMLIAAASPFHVYYSQETRMYAPLALFCALTVLFFLRAISEENWRLVLSEGEGLEIRDWIGVAVSAALAMYMQNLAAFFLLAFGLSALPRPKLLVKVAAAGGLAFLLWLPWFLNLPGQFAKLQQAYWVTRPDFVTLLQTALVYHVGEELVAWGGQSRGGQPQGLPLLGLALFTAILLPLLLGWQIFRQRREASAQGAQWLAVLAFGTPALLFLASFYQPVYIQRALLPASLMYSIALGWLLTGKVMPLPIRLVLGGLLALTASAGLWAHYTFAQFPRPSFQEAVTFLQEHAGPGDLILHSNKLTFFPMYYYDRTLPQKFLADPPGSGGDTLALPTQAVLGLLAEKDAQTAVGDARSIWFVIFEKEIEEYGGPDRHPALQWLRAQPQLDDVREIIEVGDLMIHKFVHR